MRNRLGIEIPLLEQLQDEQFSNQEIELWIARLDAVHPLISGNKYYKLAYYLDYALKYSAPQIISFGGAYSNHLHALAFAAKHLGIKSVGYIRGEQPKTLSATLFNCIENGMELRFLSRAAYRNQNNWALQNFKNEEGSVIIPEGGYGNWGSKGAEMIYDDVNGSNYSHIICACGTGTTIAGILNKSKVEQVITGISVLKGYYNLMQDILKLTTNTTDKKPNILQHYHFGGYAKYNEQLITFMNDWYIRFNIPSDFVYTGKLFFALNDLLKTGYFPKGSKVLCIHSGGLQGNRSLLPGKLIF